MYNFNELKMSVLEKYREHQLFNNFQRDLKKAPSIEEYNNLLTKAINNASDFEDIYKILNITNGLHISQDHFSSSEIQKIIEKISKGELPLNSIPSLAGLREKALELLAQPDFTKKTYYKR